MARSWTASGVEQRICFRAASAVAGDQHELVLLAVRQLLQLHDGPHSVQVPHRAFSFICSAISAANTRISL